MRTTELNNGRIHHTHSLVLRNSILMFIPSSYIADSSANLGSLALVILAIHRVGRRNDTATSVKAGMDASFSNGHRLLLHHLNERRNNSWIKK